MEARQHLLILLFCSISIALSIVPTAAAILLANETDRLALFTIKDGITTDPTGVLSSWNHTVHFCAWEGVTCGHKHPERVITLNLSSRGLEGFISPSIGNLSLLRRVLLMNNGFYGEIPSDFGRLHSLRLLNLSFNSFHGAIPMNLSYCSKLITLHLANNQLTGTIPTEIGSMPKLKSLALDSNNLTGLIPHSLGNLSSLVEFSFMLNSLEGSIPEELGNLVNLSLFQAAGNMLSGTIPSQLFNLSFLYYFSAAGNRHLHGTLPPNIGTNLQNLQVLYLGINQFNGPISASLMNVSGLEQLDLSQNNFTGKIPPELGRLQHLAIFNVISNQLEASNADDWKFLDSLTNCSQLQLLYIGVNQLGGTLPSSIANLSTTLQALRIGFNPMTGTIPLGIEKLINLNIFDVAYSFLSSTIPDGIGMLTSLQWLDLADNKFTGQIPFSIGNLTQMNTLYLFGNGFEGHIPASLGDLQKLTIMDLSNNRLTGSIPKEVVSLPYISQVLDLSNNLLEGSLPLEIGTLKNLKQLTLSGNKLSGEIPATLARCVIMEYLALDNNFFQGDIPPSLSNMKGLKVLDLSHNILSGTIPPSLSSISSLEELDLSYNNLSGPIPELLQDLKFLFKLNLSYNQLQGEVPIKGVFGNSTAVSLIGNNGLCGGISQIHLSSCPMETTERRKGWALWLNIVIPIAAAALLFSLCLTLFVVFYRKHKPKKTTSQESSLVDEQYPRVTHADLAKATNEFSSDNLIGSGRYGSVYKGNLDGRTTVAVKVFKLQERGAFKSFLAECEALRSIRHRNLIKIFTSCSSVDSQGNDFKALVFEFMPNGNLEGWLHPEHDGQHQLNHLSLIQRLNISTHVADALEYLHHSCQPPVVHCDLKPSNVLLDKEMTAHVGDLGLAKFLSEVVTEGLQDSNSSIGIKGTVGYVAPEYGAGGQVSIFGDVYSFGIVILEMFTGKRPTNDMFKDGLSLREFVVASTSPEQVMEITDRSMLLDVEGNEDNRAQLRKINECLVSTLTIGLSCSNPLPRERMNMIEAAAKMHAIRDAFVGGKL